MEPSESQDEWNLPGRWQSDAESEGESETSKLWDRESVTSIASISTVDSDVTEATFHRLLVYGKLKFFWPQLVARCGSHKESCRVVERFLRRFADDLGKLAMKPVKGKPFSEKNNEKRRSASAFVRRSRLKLAPRICEEYHYRTVDFLKSEPHPSDRANELVQYGSSLDAIGSEDEVDEIPLVDDVVEAFIFETEPICRLEENVQFFLRKDPPQPLGHVFIDAIEITLDEIVSWLGKSHLSKGLKWCFAARDVREEAFSSRLALPEDGSERSGILEEEELRKKRGSWTCVEFPVVKHQEICS